MLHVVNKIDRSEVYKFYAEGVTPSVARLYSAINAERVAVAAALGTAPTRRPARRVPGTTNTSPRMCPSA
jgi:hypothetical protein